MIPILDPNRPFRLVVSPEGVNPTQDGFATFRWFGKDMKLYEKVNLKDFPCLNNFKGDSFTFEIGTLGTIIRFVGRPGKIKKDPAWGKFDVYEVLISGKIVQLFRQNMEPI
jgi:hypothetical protein